MAASIAFSFPSLQLNEMPGTSPNHLVLVVVWLKEQFGPGVSFCNEIIVMLVNIHVGHCVT